MRTKAKPVVGPAGEMVYSVTVIEDVTDVKRAEFSQRLLARTGELISHSEDYEGMLEEIPQLLVPEFADGVSINLVRENGFIEQVAVHHRDAEHIEGARSLRGKLPIRIDDETQMADVIRSGVPALVRDNEELGQALAREAERLRQFRAARVSSAIITPLPAAGRNIGALTFVNQANSRAFDEEDLALAVELARRVALALENARLAEERVRVADALQRELLPPSLPAIPGWEVATMYEPAGELNEVGGDFYEVYRVDRGWAVVLGDVSGRGAAAASLTAEARHTIRTAGALAGDPCAGLELLDENLRSRADAALCSAVVLVLPEPDAPEPVVEVYLAGHPHPLHLREGAARPVGTPGPLLGVVDDAAWEAYAVPVQPGDQLVLYTDGVIEARGRGPERFGIERLRRRLAGCTRPDGAVERVRLALEIFGARARQDDAAVIALRFAGYPAPLAPADSDDPARTASRTSAAS
jgi:serine phosphatase RsbU (regulator of sigma subunit)